MTAIMKRATLMSAAAIVALTTVLPVRAQPGVFNLADLSGAELYGRFCWSCHGEFGYGDGPVASTLTVSVPDLTRIARRRGGEFPAQDVRAMIDGRSPVLAHGPRTMPVWGYEFWWVEGADRLAETSARALLDDIVDYIQSIQEIE